MTKHAYLIMAYNQWDLLGKLIHMLDDVRNDIYIHINVNIKDIPFYKIKKSSIYSKIVFVDRISIKRGTYSIFNAEMILLKTALSKDTYAYFHLLSGQDLPLKNQDYIHNFFEKHNGINFVDVQPLEKIQKNCIERYSLYNLMVPYILFDGSSYIKFIIARIIQKLAFLSQKKLGISKIKKFKKNGLEIGFGSHLFSITNNFASFVVSKESIIEELYGKWSFAPDESIMQTLLCSSNFKNTLYNSEWVDYKLNRANMRLIFWSGRSHPETIAMNHFEILKSTQNLFARKFDINSHPDVVNAVEQMVLRKSEANT